MPKGNREKYMQLIEEVKKRECLYVPTHPNHRDKKRLEAEWTEVGQIFGMPGIEAKKTWQNLRCSYSRCLAEEINKKTPSSKSTWYLKDNMDFLRQHMATSLMNCSTANSPSGVHKPVSRAPAAAANHGPDVKDHIHGTLRGVSLQRTVPCKRKSTTVPVDVMADDDFKFFLGILPIVRELNNVNKRKFKHKISGLLFEMVGKQENQMERSSPPLTVHFG